MDFPDEQFSHSDPDELSIANLIKRGDDLTKPLDVTYHLEFLSQSSAEAADSALKSAGFKVKTGKFPDENIWNCQATVRLVPELENLRNYRLQILEMAKRFHGEYQFLVTSRVYNEPPPPTGQQYHQACTEIVATARNILSGTTGIVEGARRLTALRSDVRAAKDPDFLFIVGIESESDHLPLGEVRRHWNPEALKRKDAELEAFEAFVRNDVFQACQSLIKRYEKNIP